MASVLQLILRTKKEGTAAKDTTKELGTLQKAAKSAALAFVALGAAKVVKNVTLLAARVETLGIVTKTLGRTAGMSEQEIRSLERAIADQGITLQGARQSIARMIQANVDLAHATDLARLAQDTAVIANLNSSEAFQQLTYVLQTGNVRMARTLGLNVQFGKAQQELAQTLGKTTQELSEQEIMQARTNAVLKAGVAISGTYEAAMGTAGKQLLSMDRQIEAIALFIGEGFLPALESVVSVLYDATSALNAARDMQKTYSEAVEDGIITEEMATEARRDLNKATWDGRDATEIAKQQARDLDAEYKKFYETLILIPDEIHELSHEFRMLHPELFETSAEGKLLAENLDKVAIAKLFASDPAMAIQLWADKDALEATDEAARELAAGLEWLFSQRGGWSIWDEIDLTGGGGGGDEGIPEGGFATYAAGVAAGMKFVGGKWVPKQEGGPVEAGRPYIVGEREAELFVPNQAGHIYNQNQLAGGDVNINNGLSQRAFNNMAEDFFRGLGG